MRPLNKVPNEKQAEAWDKAVEIAKSHNFEEPSREHVERAAFEVMEDPDAKAARELIDKVQAEDFQDPSRERIEDIEDAIVGLEGVIYDLTPCDEETLEPEIKEEIERIKQQIDRLNAYIKGMLQGS